MSLKHVPVLVTFYRGGQLLAFKLWSLVAMHLGAFITFNGITFKVSAVGMEPIGLVVHLRAI